MTFGETLKNLRSEKDLSQEEISSYLGIEESVIEQSNYLSEIAWIEYDAKLGKCK